MTISSVDVHSTFCFHISDDDGHEYKVTHREDTDGYFIPVWNIEDEYDEEVMDKEIRTRLMEVASEYMNKTYYNSK